MGTQNTPPTKNSDEEKTTRRSYAVTSLSENFIIVSLRGGLEAGYIVDLRLGILLFQSITTAQAWNVCFINFEQHATTNVLTVDGSMQTIVASGIHFDFL